MTVNLKIDTQQFEKMLHDAAGLPTSVIQDAYKFFVATTPKGDPSSWKNPKAPKGYVPGNARSKTVLQGNTIVADYAYAERLDTGWSKQAPNGMSDPTIAFMQKLADQQVAKLGN